MVDVRKELEKELGMDVVDLELGFLENSDADFDDVLSGELELVNF